MQEIIKEYGPAVISVVAVVALVGLVTVLVGSDSSSIVGKAFSDLLTNFFNAAGSSLAG